MDKLKKDKLKHLKPAKKGEIRNPFGSPGHGVKKTLAEYGYKPEEELMFIARIAMEDYAKELDPKLAENMLEAAQKAGDSNLAADIVRAIMSKPNPKLLQLAKDCNAALLEYIQPKKKAQEVAPEKPRSPEESKAAAEDAFSLLKELEDGPIERTKADSDTDSLAPRPSAVPSEARPKKDLRHDHGDQGTDRGGELQPEAGKDDHHGGDSHGDSDKDA